MHVAIYLFIRKGMPFLYSEESRNMNEVIKEEKIENMIYEIRGK